MIRTVEKTYEVESHERLTLARLRHIMENVRDLTDAATVVIVRRGDSEDPLQIVITDRSTI